MKANQVHKTKLYRANRNKVKDRKAFLEELKKLVDLKHPFRDMELVSWDEKCLMAAFTWSESPQGQQYWWDIEWQITFGV